MQFTTPRLPEDTNFDQCKKKIIEFSNQASLKQKQHKQQALHKPTTYKTINKRVEKVDLFDRIDKTNAGKHLQKQY